MTSKTLQSIEVRRLIPATPAEVFEAWIDPTLLARWFAPGDLEASVDRLEPRRGGCVRITMRNDARGELHRVGGEFLEVIAPTTIKMTWQWEGEQEQASLVTVRFVPHADGTEIVIAHDQLTEEDAPLHAEGWSACLAKLHGAVPRSEEVHHEAS
jgi:uncharacterized protein YndB with AHSA1/START domain